MFHIGGKTDNYFLFPFELNWHVSHHLGKTRQVPHLPSEESLQVPQLKNSL